MDNKYPQCPPRMSDGNFVTQWTSPYYVNEHIRAKLGLQNDNYNYYRTALQGEIGQQLLDNERAWLNKNKNCVSNRRCSYMRKCPYVDGLNTGGKIKDKKANDSCYKEKNTRRDFVGVPSMPSGYGAF